MKVKMLLFLLLVIVSASCSLQSSSTIRDQEFRKKINFSHPNNDSEEIRLAEGYFRDLLIDFDAKHEQDFFSLFYKFNRKCYLEVYLVVIEELTKYSEDQNFYQAQIVAKYHNQDHNDSKVAGLTGINILRLPKDYETKMRYSQHYRDFQEDQVRNTHTKLAVLMRNVMIKDKNCI